MKTIKKLFLSASILLVFSLNTVVVAQEANEQITKRGTIVEDLYLAGGTVNVLADVKGDVITTGGKITVGDTVDGDVFAVGGDVTIRANVSDDVRLLGGDITLAGNVNDGLFMIGGSVTIAPDAKVGGKAWLCGGNIDVAGQISNTLIIKGGKVLISGEIMGDVDITAQSIEILPNAIIHGNLNYKSPKEAQIDSTALIKGEVNYKPSEKHIDGWEQPEIGKLIALGAFFFFTVTLSIIVAGIVLYLLFSKIFLETASRINHKLLECIALGLTGLIVTPFLGVILLLTVIGIPLAILLFFAYFVFLIAAYYAGVFYVSDRGLVWLKKTTDVSTAWRVLSFVIALVVLAIVGMIPFLGNLVVFVIFLAGLGALIRYSYQSASE